jgi:uncharacterized protein (TIGR02466 family)
MTIHEYFPTRVYTAALQKTGAREFKALQRKLQGYVKSFAAAVEWDLKDRALSMTDCWVNIMPRQTVHGLHLHPLSTLSGTYYVQVPSGVPGIKFEDPRLDRFMAAPPRTANARPSNRAWITVPAVAGIWCCSRAGCATRWCPTPSMRSGSA